MKTLLRRVATRLARAPIIDTGLGFRYYQYRPQSLPYAELEAHNIEWAKNIKPGDVVFDIGGNFGTISLLAASRGATTFAFETNIGNLARLQENARLNGWWDRINGFCIAVSDETGMGTMLNNKPQLAHIGLYLEGKRRANIPGVPVRIPTFTMDDLSDLLGVPAHVKIDVDGAEQAVIKGGWKTLSQARSLSLEWRREEGFPTEELGLRQTYIRERPEPGIFEAVFVRD